MQGLPIKKGQVKKITDGWVEQIFDKDGKLVEQYFYAGDEGSQYKGDDGEYLPEEHKGYDFYSTFDMKQS